MKERLKKARQEKGFSQTKLAKLVAVTPQTVQQWEDENKNIIPRRNTITRLSKVLGVSEAWLVGFCDCDATHDDTLNIDKFTECLEIVMNKLSEQNKEIPAKDIINITVATYKLKNIKNSKQIIKNIIKLMDN